MIQARGNKGALFNPWHLLRAKEEMERRDSASLFLRIQTSHNSFHALSRRLTCLTRTPSTPPLLYFRGGGILFLEKLLSLKYPKRETLVFSQFLRRRSRELTRRCACRPLGCITPPRKDNGSLRVRVAIPSCMIALLLSVGFSSSRREPLDLGDDQALQAMANPVSRVGNRGRKGGLARKKKMFVTRQFAHQVKISKKHCRKEDGVTAGGAEHGMSGNTMAKNARSEYAGYLRSDCR